MASSRVNPHYVPELGNEFGSFGCTHYVRRCKLVAPCCKKEYSCRFCHDDKEGHELNRKSVLEVVCNACNKRQLVSNRCTSCHETFGTYFCSVCRLYDNEDKNQFHCSPCGICRIGGVNNYFHCQTCNLCLPISVRNDHKCIENASRSDCSICTEDLHSSRDACKVTVCGHLLHTACFDQLTEKGMATCPTCLEPLEDLCARLSSASLYQKPASMRARQQLTSPGSSGAHRTGIATASRSVTLKCQCCDRTFQGNANATICQYCGSKKVYPADE